MNKEVKVILGMVLLAVGAVLTWQSYLTVTDCNSSAGKISTFVNTLFGGQSAQTCYNAQILEVGGIVVAIIGLVVVLFALFSKSRK